MKRNLDEYSSDLDRSSPLPEQDDLVALPAEKRARPEESAVPGSLRSSSVLSDGTPPPAKDGAQPELLAKITAPNGYDYVLNASQLHSSNLSKDPAFYEYSIFHFDFTLPSDGRKHFEQWAASLGDELARHVKRLKFTVVGPPGYHAETPLEIPHDEEVLVQRGALTCNEPDAVLRKRLARVDEQCVGAGFGVNGLIAIGRAMI